MKGYLDDKFENAIIQHVVIRCGNYLHKTIEWFLCSTTLIKFPNLKLFSFLPKLVALALFGRLRLLSWSGELLRKQQFRASRVQHLAVTSYLSPALLVGGQVTVGQLEFGSS